MTSRLLAVRLLLVSLALLLLPVHSASSTASPYDDEFDSSTLNPKWHWVRGDPTHWSITTSPGYLRIITQRKDIWLNNNNAPLLLQSLQPFSGNDFEIRTRVVMTPTANHHQGGLVIYDDDDNYVRFTYVHIDGPAFEFAKETGGNFQPIQVPAPPGINDFHLRIVKLSMNYYGYYSQDGANWTLIGTHQNVNISPVEVGLLAFNAMNVTAIEIPADFDYFRIQTISSKPPLVLVHGFGGLGLGLFSGIGCTDNYKELRKTPAEADSYFGPLDELLEQNRQVFFARLVSNRCYTPRFNDNVKWLMEAIDEAKRATGHSKVVLVTHSMGGLVSRDYIERGQYRGDVEAVFTLGVPHHGVPHDLLTFIASGFGIDRFDPLGWMSFCANRQPGMCNFSLSGMDQFNKNHQLNPDVKYYFLTGDAPVYTRNPLGMASYALFLFQPNDGIVGLNSGKGDSVRIDPNRYTFLNRYTNDENHNVFGKLGLYDWPYFGPRWDLLTSTNSKTYTECLKPVLVDGAQTTCTSAVSAADVVNDSPTYSRTPLEGGTLMSGETATRTITVDGGLVLFTSQWHTGTLDMTLVAPNNQVIDPAYTASNPAVVSYTASANNAAYYLPNALGGEWRIVIQAGSVPLTGTSYTTLAGFATNLTLTGGVDSLWYSSGATANITATLGGSPASVSVTATVFAGGITTTIPLSPTGGGHYQNVYPVPDAPGYAVVQLGATGINTASLPFERELGFAFQISPNSAILSNSYSEAVQPYPGIPSLYQALTVTVEANSAISGTLGLSADLVDATGNFVAHSLTIQDVVTGTTTLGLRFDGADIFASQRNGPYTLTNLLLTDQTNTTLALVEAQNVYSTASYLHESFAPPKAIYLPLIRR